MITPLCCSFTAFQGLVLGCIHMKCYMKQLARMNECYVWVIITIYLMLHKLDEYETGVFSSHLMYILQRNTATPLYKFCNF